MPLVDIMPVRPDSGLAPIMRMVGGSEEETVSLPEPSHAVWTDPAAVAPRLSRFTSRAFSLLVRR